MVIDFEEARRMMKKGQWYPAEKEAHKVMSNALYAHLQGRGEFISSEIFSYSDKKITEILTGVFTKRKAFYIRKPYSDFHKCHSTVQESPVRIPFRYIEEVLMVFSLLYSIIKDKKSYPILNPEMKKVMKYLKQHVHINTPINPTLTKVFIHSIKTFNQKLITKYSYIINRLPEEKLDTFFNVFFAALKESPVIRNLFILSYSYFMNDERNMIVLDACRLNTNRRRAYKFDFDSFYWSRDIFLSVLATKYRSPTPKKKSPKKSPKK